MELVSVSFSPHILRIHTLLTTHNSSLKSKTPSRRCMYKQGQGPSTSHFLLAYYSSSCLKFPPASLSRVPMQIPMPIAKHSCTNSRTNSHSHPQRTAAAAAGNNNNGPIEWAAFSHPHPSQEFTRQIEPFIGIKSMSVGEWAL